MSRNQQNRSACQAQKLKDQAVASAMTSSSPDGLIAVIMEQTIAEVTGNAARRIGEDDGILDFMNSLRDIILTYPESEVSMRCAVLRKVSKPIYGNIRTKEDMLRIATSLVGVNNKKVVQGQDTNGVLSEMFPVPATKAGAKGDENATRWRSRKKPASDRKAGSEKVADNPAPVNKPSRRQIKAAIDAQAQKHTPVAKKTTTLRIRNIDGTADEHIVAAKPAKATTSDKKPTAKERLAAVKDKRRKSYRATRQKELPRK